MPRKVATACPSARSVHEGDHRLAGPGDGIVLPRVAADEVDYECELAIVIGRAARHVGVDDALDYVLGYTCANDVSARDVQLRQDSSGFAASRSTRLPPGTLDRDRP